MAMNDCAEVDSVCSVMSLNAEAEVEAGIESLPHLPLPKLNPLCPYKFVDEVYPSLP